AKDEIELIHNTTLELLESVGVMIDSPEARALLKENGAILDDNQGNIWVKFPEELVKEQLKHVPDSFKLWGPDGSFSFEVNTKSTQFATVGTPVKIYDPESKKQVRKTVLDDTIKQIRIVDSLKNVMCSHVDVWPNDIPFLELHCHAIKAWAINSRKPYGLGCYGKMASQDMMNLASIIVGGDEELISHPRFIGFFNPTSPLMLTKIMLNGLFIFAKYKQPTIIAPAASAGSTAPVTLAGLITQTNMELLSSIVLTQLINKGAPVFYSTMSAPMDPPTGNVAWGSIETGLITSAFAQMGRFYNIPSRGPGAVTESKVFDVQNGYERLLTLLCAATSGINYITCAGTYESSLAEALELLVIDDELIDIINRGKEGIRVNEDTIAMEEIKKIVTTSRNFLGTKHSVKNIRKELFVPKLSDRDRRGTWKKQGSKDIIQRAREKVDKILETQKGPGLSTEVEAKIAEYTKEVASRTMDYYQKAEGMEKSAEGNGVPGVKLD
ncbi:MAG: trimethylamine methyltransferase family protein, partial [Candidatus Hermodarchaeota archaeon]